MTSAQVRLDGLENLIEKTVLRTGKWKTFIAPFIGVEPVTGIAGGIAAVGTARLSKDTTLAPSFAELVTAYTQNHQFIVQSEVFIYVGNVWLVKGFIGFAKYPDRFWGIGNTTQDNALEHYDNNRVYTHIHLLHKIFSKFYAGVKYRFFSMNNVRRDLNDPNTLNTPGIVGGSGGISSGFGYSMAYDTRDNILNTYKGSYITVSHAFFGKYTGSEFNFSRFEFEARHFIRTYKKQVLAFQVVGVFNTGTPPFNMLAMISYDSDMRGYYGGRYRDMDYLAVQVEYRIPLFWRIGMVSFAGLGDVARRLVDFNLDLPKYSLGGGLRFKFNKKENINLRIDYAIGYHSSGLYIYIAESF
jgi:hypothetical protein